MNPIVFFSIFILFVTGLIGLGIYISFYYETRRKLFYFFIPGWIFFTLGRFGPLVSEFSYDIIIYEILILLSGILASIGIFLIAMGIISYFAEIHLKIAVIPCILFFIIPIILYLTFNLEIALNFSFITYSLSLMSGLSAPLFTWAKFKRIVGKIVSLYVINSIIIAAYFPIALINFSQGLSIGLYECDNNFLIMLNYIIIIGSTILTIIYFVYLEFSISKQESFDLKNKYSHNLGNILQTIYLSTGILKTKEDLDIQERLDLSKVIEEKIDQAKKFLEEIREIK
ncbi:MAG: hypothetical protein EAX96_10005 [Candidatus Lokiarchaeota archaeon]|nr:hypothetical protein [Candidatus Lokiarchaeota archaeon]